MSTLDPHPDNTTLLATVETLAHLPLRSVDWVRNGATGRIDLTVGLPDCATFEAARDLLGAKDERDYIGGSGARCRGAEWTVGTVGHVCFPHLDCWEKP